MNLNEVSKVQKKTNILFLDVSSTCTAYAVAEANWEARSAKFLQAGAIWFPKVSNEEKYLYIGLAIREYFYVTGNCDYIIHESYAINPKQMGGVLVCPEMIGAIKFAATENGIGINSISPQSWRKHCKIKPLITVGPNGKKRRDYKKPTKDFVLQHVNIPEKVLSNITHNTRSTPSDLYDAIAIGYGWLSEFKQVLDEPYFRTIEFSTNFLVNNHVGALDY